MSLHFVFATDSCLDKFDQKLRSQCGTGEWQQRYYFDHSSLTCRLFWWDGCRSDFASRNYFTDLLSCQWLCEQGGPEPAEPRSNKVHPPEACSDKFDEHYRDECTGGQWRKQFYYEQEQKRCLSFWYDGCVGQSQNIFQDEISCVETCEMPGNTLELPILERTHPHSAKTAGSPVNPQKSNSANHQSHNPRIHHLPNHQKASTKRQNSENYPAIVPSPTPAPYRPTPALMYSPIPVTSLIRIQTPQQFYEKGDRKNPGIGKNMRKASEKNSTGLNICEKANPCQNGGICVFDPTKESFYYCQCKSGYTNDNCTEKSDYDPCGNTPCFNGGTCLAKAEKTKSTYECFCAKGFAGVQCELRPCDDEPCKNNGTCRTTRGVPPFFCECAPGWGGKTCVIEIPLDPNDRKYGTSEQMISSGKVEWIEEIQKIGSPDGTQTYVAPDRLPPANDFAQEQEAKIAPNSSENISANMTSSGGASRRSSDGRILSKTDEMGPIVGAESPTRTLSKGTPSGAPKKQIQSAAKIAISVFFVFLCYM
ncbi:EGF-like domain-containing protein [Ditylenchus destructor]|nr:EGF-like domain-containing protein [Ditylenchus destructor]